MTHYEYDCRHRLVKVIKPNLDVITYRYDAFNRRISKTVNGKTTEFIWQGNKLIAETDNDKHWQSYIYEPDSYRPLALVQGNAQQGQPKLYWYQNDQLGTPTHLTESLGEIAYECRYNAYGQITEEHWPLADKNIKPVNPLRFQGQYYDEETGLHYNLNRYYDPFVGRYITQDPIKLIGGLNLYQYCPNPVNWVDPLGWISLTKNGFEHASIKMDSDIVDLYRAVGPEELANIRLTGKFGNPLGIEGKYFTISGEMASDYAKKAVYAFGDEPYTIIKTEIKKDILNNPIFFSEVDGGIPAYVLPTEHIIKLNPKILNYSPISSRK